MKHMNKIDMYWEDLKKQPIEVGSKLPEELLKTIFYCGVRTIILNLKGFTDKHIKGALENWYKDLLEYEVKNVKNDTAKPL